MSETDNKTEQNLSTQNNNSETSEENVMKGGGNSFLSLYKLWIKKYKAPLFVIVTFISVYLAHTFK